MKKSTYRYPLLWLALLFGAAGCSAEKNLEDGPEELPGQIGLRAAVAESVIEAETKVPIEAWANTQLSFAVGTNDLNFSEHWNATVSVHGMVVFSPIRSYNTNGRDYYLRGFHPRGTQGSNPNLVNFVLTGQEDLMLSDVVYAGNTHARVQPTAYFNHLLTQLAFTIVNSEESPYPPMDKITKISVAATSPSAPLCPNVSLHLTAGGISFSGSATEVVAYDSSMGEGLPIRIGESPNVAVVMIEPGKKIALRVEYSNGRVYTGNMTTITPVAGKAYEIKLTFTGGGLQPSIRLTGWTEVALPDINMW